MTSPVSIATLTIAMLLAAAPAVADDTKLLGFGRHLSQECSSCHRIDGIDNGIPSIVAWDRETFVMTMKFYKDGARNNPAMVSVAQSLDDTQMQALAAYYGTLRKLDRRVSSPPTAAKAVNAK